jgi:hypothetical protein
MHPLVPWTFPGSGDYLPRTLVHSLTFIPVSLFKGLGSRESGNFNVELVWLRGKSELGELPKRKERIFKKFGTVGSPGPLDIPGIGRLFATYFGTLFDLHSCFSITRGCRYISFGDHR